MPAPIIKIKIENVAKIRAYVKRLPRALVPPALEAIGEWLIGNAGRGLSHYQAYKYVSRRRAYGQTFVSRKQQAFVMAAISEGRMLPGFPRRTGKTQRGWYMEETKGGLGRTIRNNEPGAYYTADDTGQARLNAIAGWRKASAVIASNLAGAVRHAQSVVNAIINRGGS